MTRWVDNNEIRRRLREPVEAPWRLRKPASAYAREDAWIEIAAVVILGILLVMRIIRPLGTAVQIGALALLGIYAMLRPMTLANRRRRREETERTEAAQLLLNSPVSEREGTANVEHRSRG